MTTITTGNFQQESAARQAMSDLARAGFESGQTATCFVGPHGQHDTLPMGGDEYESLGTESSGGAIGSAATLGAIVGVAAGFVTLSEFGPGVAVVAAGDGAYAGSFVRAIENMGSGNEDKTHVIDKVSPYAEPHRKSGMLVVVSTPASPERNTAIRMLRANGGTDLDQPEGTIIGGDWADFDPLASLKLVAI
jgi:hypothetical protein